MRHVVSPLEIICDTCGRDATNAVFQSRQICKSCYDRKRSGLPPITDRANKPTYKNTCLNCGGFKKHSAKNCAGCNGRSDIHPNSEEVREGFNAELERRNLKNFMSRIKK